MKTDYNKANALGSNFKQTLAGASCTGTNGVDGRHTVNIPAYMVGYRHFDNSFNKSRALHISARYTRMHTGIPQIQVYSIRLKQKGKENE